MRDRWPERDAREAAQAQGGVEDATTAAKRKERQRQVSAVATGQPRQPMPGGRRRGAPHWPKSPSRHSRGETERWVVVDARWSAYRPLGCLRRPPQESQGALAASDNHARSAGHGRRQKRPWQGLAGTRGRHQIPACGSLHHRVQGTFPYFPVQMPKAHRHKPRGASPFQQRHTTNRRRCTFLLYSIRISMTHGARCPKRSGGHDLRPISARCSLYR